MPRLSRDFRYANNSSSLLLIALPIGLTSDGQENETACNRRRAYVDFWMVMLGGFHHPLQNRRNP